MILPTGPTTPVFKRNRKRQMAKSRAKNKLPPFVPLILEMLNSKVYWELPNAAAKLLPYFFAKVKTPYNDPSRYNTTFTFPFSEAQRYGFARSTFSQVIRDLMRLGFIDPVKKGGLRGTGLASSVFNLSKRWESYGTPEFEEIRWESFMNG